MCCCFAASRHSRGCLRLSEYEVELCSERADLDINDLLATPMSIAVDLPKGGSRYLSGHVATFSSNRWYKGRYTTCKAVLRPWLWFLTLASDCRIFQGLSVPQILDRVFSALQHCRCRHLGLRVRTTRHLTIGCDTAESDFRLCQPADGAGRYLLLLQKRCWPSYLGTCHSCGAHSPAPGYAQLRYMPSQDHALRESEVIYAWHIERRGGAGRLYPEGLRLRKAQRQSDGQVSHAW